MIYIEVYFFQEVEENYISIPKGLAEAIDQYIKDNPKLDLRSRAQVVNFALRMLFVKKK